MIPAVSKVITLALGISLAGGTPAASQSSPVAADRLLRRHVDGVPYRIFVPGGDDSRTDHPLVLFLHGGGGRGRDNEKQLAEGNGMLAEMFAASEAFVLAPQTNTEHDVKTTLAILDAVRAQYRIDPRRIYVVDLANRTA